MARTEFITISDDLVPLASKVTDAIKSRGYKVKPEPKDISLPATPTLIAKRSPETIYIFVAKNIVLPELGTWIKFCGASANDARIAICVEDAVRIPMGDLAVCQRDGLGVGAIIEGEFRWIAEPRDIAFHVSLPERQALSPKVRTILGEAYDRFEQRDWRAGFEAACLALEEEGRKYLLKNQPMGRTRYKKGTTLVTPTKKDINKLTLGGLAFVFCNLVRQNQVEAQLCSALDQLNPSRIHRIHKARRARSEAVLRRNVGTQMWLIINALNVIPR